MSNIERNSLPYRWQLGGNYLMGITGDRWLSLLRQNRFRVAREYWHRAGAITLASGLSALLGQIESWRYGRAIAATEIAVDPIFILGHWRSGTTLLHELLALDCERLACPSTFQAMSPQTFLLTETLWARWFAGLVPEHRPMDRMQIGFHSPQEDEFAIALMTLQSYYLAFSFPHAQSDYERYLTLKNLSAKELQQWQDAFLWLLRKLTFKHRRQLVLKSPPHTARIRLLLALFPQAKFVHIHRHPYRVFQSMQHYFATAGWLTYLQKPDLQGCDRAILRRYRILYDAYFAQKDLIPAGQFHEIGFSDLEQDPIGRVREIYRAFNWPLSEAFDLRLREYLNLRQDYRKNAFPPLSLSVKQQIHREWERAFLVWGYSAT